MRIIQTLAIAILFAAFVSPVFGDGCYICGSGSSSKCEDYCRYEGSDSFDKRKKCEKAGCKVSGTTSCPTASNYKVCSAMKLDSTEDAIAYLQCKE